MQSPSSPSSPSSPIRRLSALLLLALLTSPAPAQCGPSQSALLGGEVSAVCQITPTAILVAHGSELEVMSLTNPAAPAVLSPRRRTRLPSPVVKLAMTQNSSRAFALMKNGEVASIALDYSPLLTVSYAESVSINARDILADGTRVYIARTFEHVSWDDDRIYLYSHIEEYDFSTGIAHFITDIEAINSQYCFDRLARVGNVLWAGFHEIDSSILGVEGYDITNPAAPVRRGAALTNAPLGVRTRINAMTSSGSNLFVSYDHGEDPLVEGEEEDYLRAVNVSSPLNPAWQPPVQLNTHSTCMSAIGNQLRIDFTDSAVGTWDITNPANLVFMGASFDTFRKVGQILSLSGTDYWAAGPAGLMTMNTTNPASLTLRSPAYIPLPTGPKVVRQRGNTTVVLDYTLNTMRIFDLTLPDAQQLRSSTFLPLYSELIELAELEGGAIQLACVATMDTPGAERITIYDITNPASPILRSTITGFDPHLMSVSGSRLYVHTLSQEIKIIELAQPLAPSIRSTTPFAVAPDDVTCMTSWSNNALAIGTRFVGLWLVNTTNATAPTFASSWNPVPFYSVNSIAKGPLYLYVNATIGQQQTALSDTRLESLNVSNIAAPTLRFFSGSNAGGGREPELESLAYVSNPSGKFLVGVHDGAKHDFEDPDDYLNNVDGSVDNRAVIYELPVTGFFPEAIPYHISDIPLSYAHGRAAPSADGSKVLLAGDRAGLYQLTMPTSWAPGIGIRPLDTSVCIGSTASLICFASGNPTNVTYQWLRNGEPVVDGPTPWGSTISGATNSILSFSNIRPRDTIDFPNAQFFSMYYCIVSNSCGSNTEGYAYIAACAADIDNGSGTGTCDHAVDINDLLFFLTAFENGTASADIDDGSANGRQDGGVTIDDLLFFLARFEAGC